MAIKGTSKESIAVLTDIRYEKSNWHCDHWDVTRT